MEEQTEEKTVAYTIGSALRVDVYYIYITVPSCTEVARYPLVLEYVTTHACLCTSGRPEPIRAVAAELAYLSLANSLATGWRGPYTCDDDGVALDRRPRPGHRWLRAALTRKNRSMGRPKSTG